MVEALGLLGDSRAREALDALARTRRADGSFSAPAWSSPRQPDAVDWGRGAANEMLNLRIETILQAGGLTPRR